MSWNSWIKIKENPTLQSEIRLLRQLKFTFILTRHAMYCNVALRRVRANIVAVEKQYYVFWMCVCSFWYSKCYANAPYYHLWHVRLYNIFQHYLINVTIFGKKKLPATKRAFLLSLQHLSDRFLILRRNDRDVKTVHWSSCNVPIIIVIVQGKFEFFRHIFKKLKFFHWKYSCSLRTDGQTWRG